MKRAVITPLEASRKTPLRKIAELPDHLLLSVVAGLSDKLSGPVIAVWSAQLNPKKTATRH